MTTTTNQPSKGEKHAKLKRPDLGNFGRNELAILGTPCGEIKQLATELTRRLSAQWSIAYVDADHKAEDRTGEEGPNPFLQAGAALHFNDKISYQRFDYRNAPNEYQLKPFFRQLDLVL